MLAMTNINKEKEIKFCGVISEIPGISVDYFGVEAHAYFLSHCHTDHMLGLWPMNFNKDYINCSLIQEHIERSPAFIPICCSEISANFLRNEEKFIFHNNLKILPINHPTLIWVPDVHLPGQVLEFLVTLIPTGHCPGAVMFLFEGSFGNVLYTGDFRIAVEDTAKFQCLKTKLGPKPLANLYLDTTFCTPLAQKFHSRDEAVQEIIRLAQEWLTINPDHHVYINTAAQYGSEYLFGEIAGKLKCKVHVTEDKYRKYFCVDGLRTGVTLDGKATRIHNCVNRRVYGERGLTFLSCQEKNVPVRSITATTQAHLRAQEKEISYSVGVNKYQVLYSMHASLEEIQDMVNYLKPDKITPIAALDNISLADIERLLKCPVQLPTTLPGHEKGKVAPEISSSSSESDEETQISNASKRVKISRHLSLFDISPSLDFLNNFKLSHDSTFRSLYLSGETKNLATQTVGTLISSRVIPETIEENHTNSDFSQKIDFVPSTGQLSNRTHETVSYLEAITSDIAHRKANDSISSQVDLHFFPILARNRNWSSTQVEIARHVTIVPETQDIDDLGDGKPTEDLAEGSNNVTVVFETQETEEQTVPNVLIIPETEEAGLEERKSTQQSEDSDLTVCPSSQESLENENRSKSSSQSPIRIKDQQTTYIDSLNDSCVVSSQSVLQPIICDTHLTRPRTKSSESDDTDSDATYWSGEKNSQRSPKNDSDVQVIDTNSNIKIPFIDLTSNDD